jgi:DNA helicase-2/ATP-dependent DNA helicase PcrA
LETVAATAKSNIRITTIHQVKGETLEAVLVVSAPTQKSKGGYWRQWLDKTSGDGEHARFAYVASSRPRRLLAWAIPQQDEHLSADLAQIGFAAAKMPT